MLAGVVVIQQHQLNKAFKTWDGCGGGGGGGGGGWGWERLIFSWKFDYHELKSIFYFL